MKGCVSKKLVWLCLAMMLTWALASVAGAQMMPKLADGYPKRAITLINIDDPGTRDGIYARMMQTALKGISPVPILVSDEPVATGGTWMKVDELTRRPGALEGYYPFIVTTFGVVTDLLIEPRTREINAKLTDMKMVLTTEQLCYIFLQKKKAPWGKKFDDFIKYGKAHPGELKYVSFEVGSGHDICMEWILSKYGIKVKKIPQGTLQEAASAVGAGEADFTMSGADVAITNYQAGRVDVGLVLADFVPPPYDKDPDIISAKQLGLPSFAGTIMGWGVNAAVPQSHIDWLYKAMYAASQTPNFKKRWEGMIPGDVVKAQTGPESDKENKMILDAMEQPIRDIGLHIDQAKKK